MKYDQKQADNLYRDILVDLERVNKLELMKDNPTTVVGPCTISQSRRRLAGTVSNYVRRQVAKHKDVEVITRPLLNGETINRVYCNAGMNAVNPTLRYTGEVVTEYVHRTAYPTTTAQSVLRDLDALGPDHLLVELLIPTHNDCECVFRFEYDMNHLMKIQEFARPDANTERFWTAYADGYEAYILAGQSGYHVPPLGLDDQHQYMLRNYPQWYSDIANFSKLK